MIKKNLLLFGVGSALLLGGCSASALKHEEGATVFRDGIYEVDTRASMLYWEAFKPIGGHIGGISLQSGEIVVADEAPSQGSFVVDMTTITNTDVENERMRTGLLNDLASDNFFSVADYPTSRFDITKISPYEGDEDYNFTIEGDLSVKDITAPVTVYAKITSDGDRLTAHARAEVDRTDFGITIRSGSFFENLGDMLIKDIFVVEMDLVAGRQ